jgi:glucose-6-phosphate 1-dehydrogenase
METNKNNFKPTVLVIFGITGDLSTRYLLPALYHLENYGLLPKNFLVLGVSRKRLNKKEQTRLLTKSIETKVEDVNKDSFKKLCDKFDMLSFDPAHEVDYTHLREYLSKLEEKKSLCFNRLFYLAVPPSIFSSVVDKLGAGNLHKTCEHNMASVRVLIEKPFGFDLESARELISNSRKYFTDEQLYRIDHYLAKETAQNILTLRFSNPLFENVWNNKYISNIQITASESGGVEGREDFYEQTGALRDLVQSHLLQLMSLTTMDRPADQSAHSIQKQRLKILESTIPISRSDIAEQALRAQYDSGSIYGDKVGSYKKDVGRNSTIVETYVALKLNIDLANWRGVPILLRTGKRMMDRYTEIAINFKENAKQKIPGNLLTIRIVPNEGVALKLVVKKPGFSHQTEEVSMDFCYRRSFDDRNPDAYERLILDAIRGDQTLFPTSEEVIASWRVIDSVVKEWSMSDRGLLFYPAGSWGPKSAKQFAEQYCIGWRPYDPAVCKI